MCRKKNDRKCDKIANESRSLAIGAIVVRQPRTHRNGLMWVDVEAAVEDSRVRHGQGN